MDSNSEIQGYNVYPMLHFRRKFSSGVTTSVSEVVTLQTRTLRNRMPSGTVSLLSQVTSRNEAVVPSIQHCKVVCHFRRSDPRKETTSPAATHHRR